MDKVYTQFDIDNLIAQNAEESVNLEFKAGGALRKETKIEISKDVSAMANSDGGIIIYGIEEKDHKASSLKFVDGNEFTKEWLEQIIHNRIQRKIEGLIIDPIRYDGKIEQTIYVVKIPRSFNAPHMTLEKKFYKRYNFMAVEMEEYEIRDSYNRQEKTQLEVLAPSISCQPHIDRSYHDPSKRQLLSHVNINIQIRVKNISQSIERFYKIELYIHRLWLMVINSGYNDKFRAKYPSIGEEDYTVFAISDSSPIFQEQVYFTPQLDLKIDKSNFMHPIIVKLYYSNGTVNRSFQIADLLRDKGLDLTENSFS